MAHAAVIARITFAFALTLLLAGPAGAGVNQWTVIGPPANVEAMAVDPHNSAILYAASFDAVARSYDRGATWTSTPVPGLVAPSALRVAVSMTSTIYALGIAEVYRSTSGGVSWSRRTAPATFPHDLQVDATNASVIVVAATNFCFLGCTGGGVYRSSDGGGSWRRIGLEDTNVWRITLDPTSSQIIYATTESTLMRTGDGGRSWRNISPPGGGSRPDAVVDPIVPTTIYAAADAGVFRSIDSGGSWELVRPSSFGASLAPPAHGSRQLFASAAGTALSLDQGQTWHELSTAGSGLDFRGLRQLVLSRDHFYKVSDLAGAPGQILAYELRHPRRRAVRQ